MEEKNKQLLEVAEILKLIANPTRLSILCCLEQKKAMNVNELKEKFPNMSQPSISQHLNLMKLKNIIKDEKKGQFVFYRISDERILVLMNSLRGIFCN